MAAVDRKTSWGVFAFVVGLASAYLIWRLWQEQFDLIEPTVRNRVLALVGLTGAVITGWFGRSSYPRVHNFKIYALSIGVGVVSLITVLTVFVVPLVRDLTGTGIYSATVFVGYSSVLMVFLLTVAAPEYVSYRNTVRLTLAMVGLILVGFAVGILVPTARDLLVVQQLSLRDLESTAFWVFSAIAAAILLLSFFAEAQSFGIGGIHAGAVLLLAVGWLPPQADLVLQGAVLAWLPMVIAIGTLVHWIKRLENRASYDPLLRIYNRGWCDRVLAEQSRLDTRPPFGVALIDLDHFKAINDTHGHDAGDAVLKEIAQRIRLQIVPRGSVARYGGEELVVFLPRADADDLRTFMESVRAAVEESPVRHKKQRIPVTCSIGCAVRTDRNQPLDVVLTAADRAVYAAKKNGRNQIRMGRLRRAE